MNVENAKALVNEEYKSLVERLVKVARKWTSEDPLNRLMTAKIINIIEYYRVKTQIRFENEFFGFHFQYGLEDNDLEFSVDWKYSSSDKNISLTIVHNSSYKELVNELSSIVEEHLTEIGQKS